jgi:spermidine synthase
MLSPLLGGSTYTFGLILAIALLGIGLGGVLYARRSTESPATLAEFAWSAALEAVCIAIPFALGDRLAVFCAAIYDLGSLGFGGQVFSWSLVTMVVVFPAAFVAGYQFPLLIGLLGRGHADVGHETGQAYAWNTGGAILGSLAGGFGLMPLLSATGVWKFSVLLLAVLGLIAAFYALAQKGNARRPRVAGPMLTAALAAFLIAWPQGPTAAWRNNAIGAGRTDFVLTDPLSLHDSSNTCRRNILWQRDGRESNVGLSISNGYAFVVNGKVDGNIRDDATTQVMLGLLGAYLHPSPKTSFVVGLGTGSSAGWLGLVPEMERVDVVELEPAIVDIARLCTPANGDVLNNPKVNLIIGDGREVLLASRRTYDVIASEPSNPYRAGIASLYTQEFYRAAAKRLNPGGFFIQWVQAYEVDEITIRSVYATLRTVFPWLETWQTNQGDLLLMCSMSEIVHNQALLEARLKAEPYVSAFRDAWRADSLEGVVAHYTGGPELSDTLIPKTPGWINTDDLTVIEFGIARTLGQKNLFNICSLQKKAEELGCAVPRGITVNEENTTLQRLYALRGDMPDPARFPNASRFKIRAFQSFLNNELVGAWALWKAQPDPPRSLVEWVTVMQAAAECGADETPALLEQASTLAPLEVKVAKARYLWRKNDADGAVSELTTLFDAYRKDAWFFLITCRQSLSLAKEIVAARPEFAKPLAEALRRPFCLCIQDEERRITAAEIAAKVPEPAFTAPFIEAFEPEPLWRGDFLKMRSDCYTASQHRLARKAKNDLIMFGQGR